MHGKNVIIALIFVVVISSLCALALPFVRLAMIIIDHNDTCAMLCAGLIGLVALGAASRRGK